MNVFDFFPSRQQLRQGEIIFARQAFEALPADWSRIEIDCAHPVAIAVND